MEEATNMVIAKIAKKMYERQFNYNSPEETLVHEWGNVLEELWEERNK